MSVMRPAKASRESVLGFGTEGSSSSKAPVTASASASSSAPAAPSDGSKGKQPEESSLGGESEEGDEAEKPRDAIVDDSAVSDMEYMSRRMKRKIGGEDEGDVWEQDAEDTGAVDPESTGDAPVSWPFTLLPLFFLADVQL
jgi:hypothetical protein